MTMHSRNTARRRPAHHVVALGGLLAVLCATTAAATTVAATRTVYPTPRKLFGPLFVRVQMAAVFLECMVMDNRSFARMTPIR